jgi:hypothetical protein
MATSPFAHSVFHIQLKVEVKKMDIYDEYDDGAAGGYRTANVSWNGADMGEEGSDYWYGKKDNFR